MAVPGQGLGQESQMIGPVGQGAGGLPTGQSLPYLADPLRRSPLFRKAPAVQDHRPVPEQGETLLGR